MPTMYTETSGFIQIFVARGVPKNGAAIRIPNTYEDWKNIYR